MSKRLNYILLILLGIGAFSAVNYFSGILILETLKYITYLGMFILLPGWCLYRIIFIDPGSWLRQVSLGMVFGYTLEVALYLVASLFGFGLFNYSSLISMALFLPLLYIRLKKRGFIGASENIAARDLYSYLAITVLVLIVVRFQNISGTALPGSQPGGVTYYQDLVWHLSMAAEAKWHGFPFQNPSLALEPLRYYNFPEIHMAMASRITGIELVKIVTRLFPFELYFIWSLVLCWAARELIGGWKSSVAVAGLVLLVGSLSGPFAIYSFYKTGAPALYARDYFYNLISWIPYNSPTFLMGTVFFISLIVLISEYLGKEVKGRLARMIAITILLLASTFIKSILVPMIVMGLVGVLVWKIFFREKQIFVVALIFMISSTVYLLTREYTQALYINFVKVEPFFLLKTADINEVVFYYMNKHLPKLIWPGKILLPGLVIFGYAPLASFGAAVLLLSRKLKLKINEVWFFSLYFITFFLGMIFSYSGGEANFLIYETIPLAILGVLGLRLLFSGESRQVFLKGLALLLLVCGLATTGFNSLFPYIGENYYRQRYGDKPMMTDALFLGLRWLRDNTEPNSVIAVNYTQDLWKEKTSWFYSEFSEKEKYWYYSAFSERRFFLEGTFNSPEFSRWVNVYNSSPERLPFLERRQLLERFFEGREKDALLTIKDKYKVSYLLIDKRREPNIWLRAVSGGLLKLRYFNDDVDIYQII